MFRLDQQAASPQTVENIYHLASLVPDLRQAMDRMTRSHGATWAAPFEVVSELETPDGGTDRAKVRIAYTREGPPFIELIEIVEPGIVFSGPPQGVHHDHVGYYAARWRDEVAHLTGLGMTLEGTGNGLAFVRDPVTGIRYEVVSFRGRGFLDNILNGRMGEQHPLSVGG